MKQTLKILTSLVLSASFMLSSLAAPVMVGTVENAAEGVAEQTQTGMADLAADVVIKDTEETVIKEVSFDNDAEGWAYMSKKNSAGEEGMSGGVETFEDRGVYRIESTLAGVTDIRMRNNALDFETSDITKIQVVVKACGTDDYSLKMYYDCNGHGIIESYTKTISFTGDEWATVTFDTSTLRDWTGTLTHIRFVVGQVAETAYYVDSIKFYGYETETYAFLPGYNILTGTKEALDFDDLTSLDGVLNASASYGTVVASIDNSPVNGGTGKALKLGTITSDASAEKNRTSIYPIVKFGAYHALPTDGRRYLIKLKTAVTNTDSFKFADVRYGKDNSESQIGAARISKTSATNSIDSYMSHYFTDDKSTKDIAEIFFTVEFSKTFTEKTVLNTELWLDDISYIPYYKVTYMNGDTKLGEAWVLDDGAGNLLTSFDPSDYDDEITFPAGTNAWSLKKDGKPTHNITLNNEDIVVYAVHERNFTPGINILTGTEEALNFNNMQDVTVTDGILKDAEGNLVLTYDKNAAARQIEEYL